MTSVALHTRGGVLQEYNYDTGAGEGEGEGEGKGENLCNECEISVVPWVEATEGDIFEAEEIFMAGHAALVLRGARECDMEGGVFTENVIWKLVILQKK